MSPAECLFEAKAMQLKEAGERSKSVIPPKRRKKMSLKPELKGPTTKEIQSYYDSYLRSMSTIKP